MHRMIRVLGLSILSILCIDVLASEDVSGSVLFTECSSEHFSGCLNGVTAAVTSFDSVRSTGARGARTIRDASEEDTGYAALGSGHAQVYAAGDAGNGLQWWGNYAHADHDSDFVNSNNESLAYSANVDSGTAGVHGMLGDRVLIGAAIGYEDQRLRTAFNGGGGHTEGLLVTPYAAVLLGEHFSIDASVGYSSLDFSQFRIAPDNGTTINASFDGDRWFVNANFAAFTSHESWLFGANVGILRIAENQDGYIEVGTSTRLRTVAARDVTLTQLTIGGDIAYQLEFVEPYGYAIYRNDIARDDGRAGGSPTAGLPSTTGAVIPDDDDEIELGLGLRFGGDNPLSGAIEGNYIAGREAYDGWTLSATLRYQY